MSCYHPLRAWRTERGEIRLSKEPPAATQDLLLPCGNCLGCRKQHAQGWALRCQLELQQHNAAVFATLTYDDAHKPVTLAKRHLQLWLKRLRFHTDQRIRFFATGEYGERTQRPHYHAILYGVSEREASRLEETWAQGHVRTYPATPANIAYTAGYCSKKIGYRRDTHERVDPETGEVYQWQPPFIQMSRNPGIGAHARQWVESWRLYAIKDGHKMPVPRYLHEAWKAQATPEQQEELTREIQQLTLNRNKTEYTLNAEEKIESARQAIQADGRKL